MASMAIVYVVGSATATVFYLDNNFGKPSCCRILLILLANDSRTSSDILVKGTLQKVVLFILILIESVVINFYKLLNKMFSNAATLVNRKLLHMTVDVSYTTCSQFIVMWPCLQTSVRSTEM